MGHVQIISSIFIDDNVWIGSGAIILGGCTIGEHSVVAAGAVVTKDVGLYTVFAGEAGCYHYFLKFQ